MRATIEAVVEEEPEVVLSAGRSVQVREARQDKGGRGGTPRRGAGEGGGEKTLSERDGLHPAGVPERAE